jgi:hypothetical protein
MTNKFVVGQAVDFNKRMSGGPYEVVSVLPMGEDNSATYRVKSKAEPFARVARETDLVAVDLPPDTQTGAGLWTDLVSGRRLSRPPRSR